MSLPLSIMAMDAIISYQETDAPVVDTTGATHAVGNFVPVAAFTKAPLFVPTGNTKKEFLKHVTSSNGWPCDDRCGCLFCPDCRKGESPAAHAGGSCPVCKRLGSSRGSCRGEESKTTKTREKTDDCARHDEGASQEHTCPEGDAWQSFERYYTLPPAVRPCLDKAVEHGLDKIDSVGRLMWKLYGKSDTSRTT